jgi:hypothetical protein
VTGLAVARHLLDRSNEKEEGDRMASVTKYLVALAVLALSTTARAGPNKPIGGAAGQGACHDDIERLCKDVQPGEGRVLACLKSHKADVSKGCTSAIQQLKAQLKTTAAACEPDVEKFCWDTPVGKGGITQCLKKHKAELSADCKTAVAKAKQAKGKALTQPMQTE